MGCSFTKGKFSCNTIIHHAIGRSPFSVIYTKVLEMHLILVKLPKAEEKSAMAKHIT